MRKRAACRQRAGFVAVLSGFGGGTELFFLGLQKKIILLSAEMRQERLREELYGIPLSREQEKRETAELTSYYYSLPPRERHLFFYLMKETMYFVLKEREI